MYWRDYSHTGTCPRCGATDVQIAIDACFDCTTAAEVRETFAKRVADLENTCKLLSTAYTNVAEDFQYYRETHP